MTRSMVRLVTDLKIVMKDILKILILMNLDLKMDLGVVLKMEVKGLIITDLKKHKVSGMKHGAKGKGSIPKDKDEHPDEDDPEDTVERVNQCKPGKQVVPKQCKVDGKKSAKGKGARGQATKGQSTKSKARPPTHHSTH